MKKIDLHIHTVSTISDNSFSFNLENLKKYVSEAELDAIRARLESPEEDVEQEEEEDVPPPPILPELFFYALLSGPLESGQLYHFSVAGVRNVNGLRDGGGEAGITWTRPDPPPGDSTGVGLP